MDEEERNIVENDKQNNKNGIKENLYDKIPLTKSQLDVIIFILLIAFVVFFVLGALIGNGVI